MRTGRPPQTYKLAIVWDRDVSSSKTILVKGMSEVAKHIGYSEAHTRNLFSALSGHPLVRFISSDDGDRGSITVTRVTDAK